jgi:glyoxylase-like metal-dependent hydrolase (beta-lactamase superfamily II)
VKVGALRIDPVFDASQLVEPSVLWDKVEDDWLPHREHLTESGKLPLDFGGFLVRGGDAVVLVDTGYGPNPVSAAVDQGLAQFPTTGHLLDSLRALEVQPEEVSHVLFTHLHADHLGWAAVDGKATFPNASYQCHVLDHEFFFDAVGPGEHDHHRKQMVVECLSPLEQRLTTFDHDGPIVPGVNVVLAAGHTPGSTIIVVSSGSERVMLLGDIVHCPVELTDPEWATFVDVDKELALRTREWISRELEETGTLTAPGHLPGLAFGRVIRGEGRRRWQVV